MSTIRAVRAGRRHDAANGAPSTAFATSLAVLVENSSDDPVQGVSVTFTAPASGASGTFANSTVTVTEITNSSGIATASIFTANATTGSYSVTAVPTGLTTPSATFAYNVTVPTVTTPTSASVESTTATLGGDVTSNGGAA